MKFVKYFIKSVTIQKLYNNLLYFQEEEGLLSYLFKFSFGQSLFTIYARIFHGIVFREASQDDKDALYRFRYTIFSKEGYIDPLEYPDKVFKDKYDPVSVSVIAVRNNEIVGAGRIIHASEVGMRTFECFNIRLPSNIEYESIVEMGRFMVDSRYRGKSRIVTIGLTIQIKCYLLKNSTAKWLIAFMPDKVREAFQVFVPFKCLEEGPLEQRHLKARKLLPGYWDKDKIHAVIAKTTELL